MGWEHEHRILDAQRTRSGHRVGSGESAGGDDLPLAARPRTRNARRIGGLREGAAPERDPHRLGRPGLCGSGLSGSGRGREDPKHRRAGGRRSAHDEWLRHRAAVRSFESGVPHGSLPESVRSGDEREGSSPPRRDDHSRAAVRGRICHRNGRQVAPGAERKGSWSGSSVASRRRRGQLPGRR